LWSAAHPDLAKFASFGKGTYSVIQEIANATGLLTSIALFAKASTACYPEDF
jgi:hypothetical protein